MAADRQCEAFLEARETYHDERGSLLQAVRREFVRNLPDNAPEWMKKARAAFLKNEEYGYEDDTMIAVFAKNPDSAQARRLALFFVVNKEFILIDPAAAGNPTSQAS